MTCSRITKSIAAILVTCVTPVCWSSPAHADEASEKLAKYDQQIDEAIDKGLAWLAKNQQPDGSFAGNHGKTSAAPALAGMAFLSKGYTPGLGPYGERINHCIDNVLRHEQKPDGYLSGPASGNMYAHCICTLFLSEASGMVDPVRQKKIDDLLPRAVLIILKAQQVKKGQPVQQGGWRYTPQATDSDLSLTGWAIMALRSAKLNGAEIPDSAIAGAVQFVLKCRNAGGFFQYQPNGGGQPAAMTGVAVLCLSLCGQHENEALPKAGVWLLANVAQARSGHPYYSEYYCAQAMFQLGGSYWEKWADAMYPRILQAQAGDGSWESAGYATAMSILAVTVSYRQLPVYQR
jgi:hypothetical protein